MQTATQSNSKSSKIAENLALIIRRKASTYEITRMILGGEQFMLNEPVSGLDFLLASNIGVPKSSIENLANVMDISMENMAVLLSIPYKTLTSKERTDVFGSLVSSMSIEIATSIAKGLLIFEDSKKLNRWLKKENKALNMKKPFDLLNTPTGIKLVNQIMNRIEDGIYS